MESAAQQLALALYEDYGPRGEGVDKAPSVLGYRRSNAFGRIVDLSLAGRRLVDVAYFLVSDVEDIRPEYRVDFCMFKWLLGTTSNNRRHFQGLVREAQRAAIELNGSDVQEPAENDRWGSVPLLGPAFIDNGEFIFELPERLQRAIKNPRTAHFLSLRYIFKSNHSKILFDRLQAYREPGVTPWFELDDLLVWLECAEKKTYRTYKYFRDKVLSPATAEIQELTGMQVDILTNNVPGSKKIGQVRFRMRATQTSDAQNVALVVLKATYETLRDDFALTQKEFNEIIANREVYTDERIQRAIEYTHHNIARGKVKLRAGGYLMKALREDYQLGMLDKKIHERKFNGEASSQTSAAALAEREKQREAQELERRHAEVAVGHKAYALLPATEQTSLMFQFLRSPMAKIQASRLKIDTAQLPDNLADELVYDAFGSFVANRLPSLSQASLI